MKFDRTKMIEALGRVVQRMHYPLEVMLVCVRWYAAYPLSFRNIEEMMAERGVFVDHATLHRWSIKMLPVLAAMFRRRKRPVGRSWRMDETYRHLLRAARRRHRVALHDPHRLVRGCLAEAARGRRRVADGGPAQDAAPRRRGRVQEQGVTPRLWPIRHRACLPRTPSPRRPHRAADRHEDEQAQGPARRDRRLAQGRALG